MVPVYSLQVAAQGMCTDLVEHACCVNGALKCFVCSLHWMQIRCTSLLQILTSGFLPFLKGSVAKVELLSIQSFHMKAQLPL